MGELRIRRAKIEDHQSLRGLYEELDGLHRARASWLFKEPERDSRPESYFQEMLEDGETEVLLAEGVGCVGLAKVVMRWTPNFPLYVRQRYAVIDELVVRSEKRRAGVGRELCEACESWARKQGARWVQLDVFSFNEGAVSFYGECGYEPVQVRMQKKLMG